jgi:hypothetical protein
MDIEPRDHASHPMGEDFGVPMEIPVADDATSKAEATTSENEYISLGEAGDHKFKDTRYGQPIEPGFVTAYHKSREWVADHERVIWIPIGLIAVGALIRGVSKLRHDNKK